MSTSNDESQKGEKSGQDLLEMIAGLSGLPSDVAQNELETILSKSGHSAQEDPITLEDLRAALVKYLESLDSDYREMHAQMESELSVEH